MSWVQVFIKRNNLDKRNSTSLAQERSDNASIITIRKWFEEIYTNTVFSKLKPAMIANLDETMLVSRNKLCCVVKRGSRFAVIKDDDPGEHVTMLACVTTVDGSKLPPFFIFPLKTLPKSLDEGIKKNQLYVGGQDSGRITMQNFKEYAKVIVD